MSSIEMDKAQSVDTNTYHLGHKNWPRSDIGGLLLLKRQLKVSLFLFQH